MFDVLIKGGRVFDEDSGREASIAVADGRVAAVVTSGELAARKVIDATGKLVFPGFVDFMSISANPA